MTHIPPSSDIILSVGGVNPFHPEVELQARLVEQFHPRDNSWTTMTHLPDGRHHHGAALVDRTIYIIGEDLVQASSLFPSRVILLVCQSLFVSPSLALGLCLCLSVCLSVSFSPLPP